MEQYEAVVNREALKQAMADLGLSNQKLADLAGVSKGTIGGLLTKRDKCSLIMSRKIAYALGTGRLALFTYTVKEGK